MSQPATVLDVARHAGVSASTVSRVLNGTARVAAHKEAAVLRAVQELGYRPNIVARTLVSGRSMSVGVLTQDISSPFYGETLRGVEDGLAGTGYHPLFASGHWRVEEEEGALVTLLDRPVDALIVLGGHTPDARLLALAERLPLVAVGRSLVGGEERAVRLDQVRAARDGVRHLVELGHRRIAHLAGPHDHRDALDRLQGYREALDEAGIAYDPRLVAEGDFLEPSGVLGVEALVARGVTFTAIFAGNDQMAYGARLALYRRVVRVPEDVSLLGFDDLPGSAYTTPPLTTVRQPTYEMGRQAARLALDALGAVPVAPGHPPVSTLAAELVVRESTAPLRSRSPRLRR